MPPSAVINSNPGPFILPKNAFATVTQVRVTSGQWLIFAKVDVTNDDNDAQEALAQLVVATQHPPLQIDLTVASAPGTAGGNTRFACLSNLTWWTVGSPVSEAFEEASDVIQLNCQTYHGAAQFASLVAIPVTLLDPTTDFPTTDPPLVPSL